MVFLDTTHAPLLRLVAPTGEILTNLGQQRANARKYPPDDGGYQKPQNERGWIDYQAEGETHGNCTQAAKRIRPQDGQKTNWPEWRALCCRAAVSVVPQAPQALSEISATATPRC